MKALIKVEVRLFAYFRQGRGKKQFMELEDDTSILKVLEKLSIDKEEARIVLLNGIDGPLDRKVKDGDVLSLFPPVGGG